jgi:hypothetical protein
VRTEQRAPISRLPGGDLDRAPVLGVLARDALAASGGRRASEAAADDWRCPFFSAVKIVSVSQA